jgi:type IV secretory pathway TrbD component
LERQFDNNTVFISATEPILYSGCDYRLFWALGGLCTMGIICVFAALPLPTSLYGIGVVLLFFLIARWGLRELAKYDPLGLPIYLRHIKWPAWLPATGKVLRARRPNALLRRK